MGQFLEPIELDDDELQAVSGGGSNSTVIGIFNLVAQSAGNNSANVNLQGVAING